MRRLIPFAMLALLLVPPALAGDAAPPSAPPAAGPPGPPIPLEDMCVRRKFLVDNCVGSLYTPKPAATEAELLSAPGDKLLRLDITEDRIRRERVMGAFEEGFLTSAPDIARSPDARKFLSLFNVDFYRGDRVDLFLGGNGKVSATYNGRELGTVESSPLVRGILKVWSGRKPADEAVK